jgi:hypothetical protein
MRHQMYMKLNQLTNVIPVVKANIASSLANIEDQLYSETTCYQLGSQFNNFQNALCVKLLSSIDSLWLSFFFIGIFGAISMPAIIWAANVVFATAYAPTGPGMKITKKDLKKAKNASEKKANKKDQNGKGASGGQPGNVIKTQEITPIQDKFPANIAPLENKANLLAIRGLDSNPAENKTEPYSQQLNQGPDSYIKKEEIDVSPSYDQRKIIANSLFQASLRQRSQIADSDHYYQKLSQEPASNLH